MQRVTCEMQAHIFSLPFLSTNIAFVHIEAYAPMLESSCGGLHPDNGNKTSAQAYAPMLESSCGGLRPYNGKKTSASSKAVRPRLPGGLRPEAGERHRN